MYIECVVKVDKIRYHNIRESIKIKSTVENIVENRLVDLDMGEENM